MKIYESQLVWERNLLGKYRWRRGSFVESEKKGTHRGIKGRKKIKDLTTEWLKKKQQQRRRRAKKFEEEMKETSQTKRAQTA